MVSADKGSSIYDWLVPALSDKIESFCLTRHCSRLRRSKSSAGGQMRRVLFALCTAAMLGMAATTADADPVHAISMHGKPALPAEFEHLPYANPDAPKGGSINYGWLGTFDSVNPFIVQGTAARGTVDLLYGDLVFDRLMQRSADDAFLDHIRCLPRPSIPTTSGPMPSSLWTSGQIFRRPAGNAGRRDLHSRDPA
jgi:hypothetical protein